MGERTLSPGHSELMEHAPPLLGDFGLASLLQVKKEILVT